MEGKPQDGGGNVQLSSVAQSCLTLGDPMACSVTGFPVWYVLLSSLVLLYSALEISTRDTCLTMSARNLPSGKKEIGTTETDRVAVQWVFCCLATQNS